MNSGLNENGLLPDFPQFLKETEEVEAPSQGASAFSLLPSEVRARLADLAITKPTAIQQESIKPLIHGRDLLGQSHTGSGKTLAFLLPMAVRLNAFSGAFLAEKAMPRALILAPTRELAIQVGKVFNSVFGGSGLKCLVLTGGAAYHLQKQALAQGVDVVVGTPGRVTDLLAQGVLSLQKVSYFVLDEVDQMLDIGFAEDLKKIRSALTREIQTAFFSATLSPKIRRLADQFLRNPARVHIEGSTASPQEILHETLGVKPGFELEGLMNALLYHDPEQGLIFCETKNDCAEVCVSLSKRGFDVGMLNSDLSQNERTKTLERFRTKQLRYLVATNVAARGIDIAGLPLVVNHSVPQDAATYTHRAGRTGRAGAEGRAWTIVTPRSARLFASIVQSAGIATRKVHLPTQSEILRRLVAREIEELQRLADGGGQEFSNAFQKNSSLSPVRDGFESGRNVQQIVQESVQNLSLESARDLLQSHLLKTIAKRDVSECGPFLFDLSGQPRRQEPSKKSFEHPKKGFSKRHQDKPARFSAKPGFSSGGTRDKDLKGEVIAAFKGKGPKSSQKLTSKTGQKFGSRNGPKNRKGSSRSQARATR